MAKTSVEKKAALKAKNGTITAARQVRKSAYQQALTTLKTAKQLAKSPTSAK